MKPGPGRAVFLDLGEIYTIEAERDDCLFRTARKRRHPACKGRGAPDGNLRIAVGSVVCERQRG